MTNLFGHRIRSEQLLLFVSEGCACFAAVLLVLALSGHAVGPVRSDPEVARFVLAGVLALGSGLVSGAGGLYQHEAWSRAGRLLLGSFVAVLLFLPLTLTALLLFGPIRPGSPFWREVLDVVLATTTACWATRLAFVAAWRLGFFTRRLVVVRQSPDAASACRVTDEAGLDKRDGYELAFTVQPGQDLETALSTERLHEDGVWGVVCEDGVLPAGAVHACKAAGVLVFGRAEFAEGSLGRVNTAALREGWLLTARVSRESVVEAGLRRGLDVLLSALLLLGTLPIILVAAAAIRLDSRGPVFYSQTRVGLGGRVFKLFKFRSMVADAEAGGAPQWASRRDSRVTRVGRFLRLTRIDEIPQVFNVLRGDMSFVGPRPERPAFVESLGQAIPRYHDRACVKPGITGWAQVNYPYGASVEDARMKLAYDLYYVKRRSLFLDLLVIIATVRVVLFQEGSR